MIHQHEGMAESANSYDSTRFMTWARTPVGFQNALPHVVREFLNNTPLTTSNSEAIWAYDQMITQASRLHNDGSSKLLSHLYGIYAAERGLQEDVDVWGKTMTLPVDPQKLSDEQRSAWDTYLYTAEVPRDVAVGALQRVIYLSLPSVKYIDDPFVKTMHERLSSVPYILAESMLPDITDDEAKSMFGQLTRATDVHVQATSL